MWISGGNLQLGKCFYYAFTPTMDFKSNSVKYKKITSVSGISIINPADGKRTNIAGLQPSDSRRTLGVLLSPDGKGINQLKVTLSKAKEFFGKFMNSSLSPKAKWMAITTVIEPALLYPLVTFTFSTKDFQPIDSITSQMKCVSLGLNRHFPRAVLHGPMLLGGLGYPLSSQKNARDRLNYFFYDIRSHSTLSIKFEMSIIYTQIECGLFMQFFSASFLTYGHLVFPSFCVQLWQELEPHGIILRPAENVTWAPSPLCSCDAALMEIAIKHNDNRGSAIINRCRQFLQVISVVNLLIPHTRTIHPSYIDGYPPSSRVSTILWPPIPRPPKNYWKLWSHFITKYIIPNVSTLQIDWKLLVCPRFSPTFYKHYNSVHLFQLSDDQLTLFKLQAGASSQTKAIYLNVPYLCNLSFNSNDFSTVDVHHHTKGWSVVGNWYIIGPDPSQKLPQSLSEAFLTLPIALQQTCGTIRFPSNDVLSILQKIQQSKNNLYGASDASLKDGKAFHAWIISSGEIDDIEDPLHYISGSGPIHGIPHFLSSARGELQGITAVAIIANLLSEYHNKKLTISSTCDKTGVINRCSKGSFSSLRRHRTANIDLYLTQRNFHSRTPMQLSWVKGHSNKKEWETFNDLRTLNLPRDETYNMWCDRMAQQEQTFNTSTSHYDPEVLGPEKWAAFSIYPVYHKITGCFNTEFLSSIGYEKLAKYLQEKHSICSSKLDKVNTQALHTYLSSLNIQQRVSVVKLIHKWVPTYSNLCRQGREPSPICLRCKGAIETSNHVHQCPYPEAVSRRTSALLYFLSSLIKIGTPVYIVHVFEYKLSIVLDLPFSKVYNISSEIPQSTYILLLDAIRHQNILGWDQFLCGYTSIYWQ